MPTEALDEGWDEIGRELALEDAMAFATAFSEDQGGAAVQAQAAILPVDASAAWDVTREAVVENWTEMVFHALTVIDHLQARTSYEPEAAESLILMGHKLQLGLTALNAFGSRFSENATEGRLQPDAPPGSVH